MAALVAIVTVLSWAIVKANKSTTRFDDERASYVNLILRKGRYIRYLEWKLKFHKITYSTEAEYEGGVETLNKKLTEGQGGAI